MLLKWWVFFWDTLYYQRWLSLDTIASKQTNKRSQIKRLRGPGPKKDSNLHLYKQQNCFLLKKIHWLVSRTKYKCFQLFNGIIVSSFCSDTRLLIYLDVKTSFFYRLICLWITSVHSRNDFSPSLQVAGANYSSYCWTGEPAGLVGWWLTDQSHNRAQSPPPPKLPKTGVQFCAVGSAVSSNFNPSHGLSRCFPRLVHSCARRWWCACGVTRRWRPPWTPRPTSGARGSPCERPASRKNWRSSRRSNRSANAGRSIR